MTRAERRILEYLKAHPDWHYGLDIVKAGLAKRWNVFISLGHLEENGFVKSRREPKHTELPVRRVQYRATGKPIPAPTPGLWERLFPRPATPKPTLSRDAAKILSFLVDHPVWHSVAQILDTGILSAGRTYCALFELESLCAVSSQWESETPPPERGPRRRVYRAMPHAAHTPFPLSYLSQYLILRGHQPLLTIRALSKFQACEEAARRYPNGVRAREIYVHRQGWLCITVPLPVIRDGRFLRVRFYHRARPTERMIEWAAQRADIVKQ